MPSERIYETPDAPGTYSDHYMLVDQLGAISATKVRIDALKTWMLAGYASGYGGGNIATLTNGAASAGQRSSRLTVRLVSSTPPMSPTCWQEEHFSTTSLATSTARHR